MWGIVTKKIGRVTVKEQGKSEHLLFNRSLIQGRKIILAGKSLRLTIISRN
jgi:hypothetical protein